jgi:hypothetical protein
MGDDPMALLGLEGALKHYYYYEEGTNLALVAGRCEMSLRGNGMHV